MNASTIKLDFPAKVVEIWTTSACARRPASAPDMRTPPTYWALFVLHRFANDAKNIRDGLPCLPRALTHRGR